MKTIRFHAPGGPEKLQYEEEPVPDSLKPDQLLVEVRAVGVIGPELSWPIYQDSNGKYFNHVPGHDFSGVVRKVGSAVTKPDTQPGADVMAFTSDRDVEGAMAQFALAAQKDVVPKPRNLSFVEAASVPLSALTSWQALYDHAGLQAGQKLLVTGAAGPTSMFAVQIGKLIGAEVIGTASSPESFEMLKSLGIDRIIDYKKENVETEVQDVDVVLDCVGGEALKQGFRVLKKDGVLISIVEFNCAEQASTFDKKGLFFIVSMNADQLGKIKTLLEDGKLKTVIDSTFPFDDIKGAFGKALGGHAHGKVVLNVQGE